jgi:hypothetical protein
MESSETKKMHHKNRNTVTPFDRTKEKGGNHNQSHGKSKFRYLLSENLEAVHDEKGIA